MQHTAVAATGMGGKFGLLVNYDDAGLPEADDARLDQRFGLLGQGVLLFDATLVMETRPTSSRNTSSSKLECPSPKMIFKTLPTTTRYSNQHHSNPKV